ncbi:hypothetical protein IFR05_011330 [Cadophora sp. M221]|nr:hypothetical protein IFR05_011330 [Cadophora sp. M221]
MLSGVLDSNYKRYKTDTSIFIKWLSDNGTKCGYKVTKPSAQVPSSEPKAPRLKGKARKEAKKAAAPSPAPGGSSPTASTASPKNFIINTSELLPLANAIVASKEPVEVPADIIRAGLRAISARKRSAAFFGRSTKDQDEETMADNQSHSYFISLMEKVLSTLQPCFAVFAGAESIEASSSENILETLENRFASLEVEEPVEPKTGPAPKAELPIYELQASKEANKDEENLFLVFCLFDDLARLRSYVMDVWEQFKQGKVDLITASVVTNTAFQLAIRAQDEILVDFPASADYDVVLTLLVTRLSKAHNTAVAAGAQGEVEIDDNLGFEIDDNLAQWIYAPAHSLLDSFCDVLDPKFVPMMKRGHFGIYNPRADRTRMSGPGKLSEDLIVLMELLPEFCFISKYKIHMFATDELTRGLGQMALTKDIPIWLVFATTIFLDIHHILREKIDLGFHELQTRAGVATSQLDRYFELSRGLLKTANWPMHNEKSFAQIHDEMNRFILNDVVLPFKESQYQSFRQAAPDASEKFYLYKRHPVLCGIQAFAILLEIQQAGITLNTNIGTVIYPAHFYNALKQNDPSCASWPLIDEVIALHGAQRIFVGGTPSTMKDCFKQICIMLGYSPTQFAKNRRNLNPVVSKNGPRGLKETSPITELFYKGLRHPNGKMAITMHSVEELLNEQARDVDLASNPTSKKLRREWAANNRLTSLQLLEALRASIPKELPKLEFDYFKLHAQSIGLMRRLKRDLDADYIKFYGSARYIMNESELVWLGPYAVMAAAGTERVAEELGITDAGSKLLAKAAMVMEKYLREQGAI